MWLVAFSMLFLYSLGYLHRQRKLKVFPIGYFYLIAIMALTYPLFIGGYEWLWIVVIVVVFLFGAKKVPELARAVGRARGEFEKGKKDMEKIVSESTEEEKEEEDEKTRLIKAAQDLGLETKGKNDGQLRKEMQEILNKK